MTERPQPCGHWAQHASRSRRHRSGGSRPSGTRALRDSRPEVSGCRSAGPADRHRNRKSATRGRERTRRERRRQLQRGSWPRRQPAASAPPGRQRVLSPPRGPYGQPQRIALPANFERLSARLLLATEWPASRLLSVLVFGRSAPGHEAHHPVITRSSPPEVPRIQLFGPVSTSAGVNTAPGLGPGPGGSFTVPPDGLALQAESHTLLPVCQQLSRTSIERSLPCPQETSALVLDLPGMIENVPGDPACRVARWPALCSEGARFGRCGEDFSDGDRKSGG